MQAHKQINQACFELSRSGVVPSTYFLLPMLDDGNAELAHNAYSILDRNSNAKLRFAEHRTYVRKLGMFHSNKYPNACSNRHSNMKMFEYQFRMMNAICIE